MVPKKYGGIQIYPHLTKRMCQQGRTNSVQPTNVVEKEMKFPTSSAAAGKLLTLNCDLPVGIEEKEDFL